ncbi:hypothetical protein SAMN05444336_101662 [Albimonas donghaensis]|uniref:Yip1 domain-containing protein n=1 Tax=Albimonas donghaensis TaxID=356660 RepID=A0A1H2SH86_9RHOB|nr:hypothetical protein [Albimonas donghaensis]SDW30971.1 hypothetical protein SAMN05444336_101662 [Albimonas donghaensis]
MAYVTGSRLDEDLPPSLGERVLEGWRDMRASTKRLIAEAPSEGRLLFYVVISDMVFFLSWTMKTVLAPTAAAQGQMPLEMGAYMVIAFLMRTAVLYVFAAGAYALCALVGGSGSWKDTRIAIFWGTLVSAPFGLLAASLTVGLSLGERSIPALGDPILALPTYYVGLVPFLWFISAGLAAAHGWVKTSWPFLALSAGTVALSVLAVYLSA